MSQVKINKALEKARRFVKKGDKAGAGRLYQEILAIDPGHVIAARKLQELGIRLPDNPGAASNPQEPPRSQLQALFGLMQQGAFQQAESTATRLITAFPKYVPLYNVGGASLLEQGKFAEAVKLFDQAVALDPGNPETHKNLAIAYYRSGDLGQSEQALNRALQLAPDNPALLVQRGNLRLDMNNSLDALQDFQDVLTMNGSLFEAQLGLANSLTNLQRLPEALEAYDRCLKLSADHVGVQVNRANVLKQLGRLDESVDALETVCQDKPDEVGAACNLASIYINEGRYDEAAAISARHINNTQHGRVVIGALAQALNYDGYQQLEPDNAHVQLQTALQAIPLPEPDGQPITDAQVHSLLQNTEAAFSDSGLVLPEIAETQLWRGLANYQSCDRHFVVFNEFNAIPEYCFDCYKVYVEPRNVVELIKLLLVFHEMQIPGDPDRKCMIETRADVPGSYKGYIYCRYQSETEVVRQQVKAIVAHRISDAVTVSLKRGCSEYALAYPDYTKHDDNDQPVMTYDETWKEHELYADEHLVKHIYPPAVESYNHPGINLQDALVIRNWLAYAAAIGDDSYQQLTDQPVRPLKLKSPRRFRSQQI